MQDMMFATPLAFSFHGDELLLVEQAGQPYVAARPIAVALGLDWKSQHRKLAADPRWSMVMVTTVAEDTKLREMACLPLRKLFGWLTSIQPARVREDVRAKLALYQEECDEALYRYWTGRAAQRAGAQEAEAEGMAEALNELAGRVKLLQAMLLIQKPRWAVILDYVRGGERSWLISKLMRTPHAQLEAEMRAMRRCGVLSAREYEQANGYFRGVIAAEAAPARPAQGGFEFGEARS